MVAELVPFSKKQNAMGHANVVASIILECVRVIYVDFVLMQVAALHIEGDQNAGAPV